MFYWKGIKLYNTEQELYDSCMVSERGKTIIAQRVYSEDGELIGYTKYYVD